MKFLNPLFDCLSPSGARARLSVLIFHRVLDEPDTLFPDEMHARRFNEVCGWLAAWFNVLPLDEAIALMKVGDLPARSACITFDDGYEDNYRVAMPILQRHHLTATFFIATEFLDGGYMWNDALIESVRSSELPILDLSSLNLGCYVLKTIEDRRSTVAALIDQMKYLQLEERAVLSQRIAGLAGVTAPHNVMMTSNEVKLMRSAGMQIGAHTINHPILARLTDEQAEKEIKGSKDFLEQLLGERVGLFAYPNGKPVEDYTPQSVEVVRRLDFDAAVSTQWGTSSMQDDFFQVRRFTPWDKTRMRFGARLLNNLAKR